MNDDSIMSPSDVADDSTPNTPAEPNEPVESHQRATNTPAWLHAATARRLRWGLGRELTRTAYLAAITETASHPCGA